MTYLLRRAAEAIKNEALEIDGDANNIAVPRELIGLLVGALRVSAPERVEAKAVAPVNPQQLAAWLTAGFAHCGVDTCAAEVLKVVEATLPPLYATPQPPPAPRFRDPTIGEVMEVVSGIFAQDEVVPIEIIAENIFDWLNAIGAKVEDKT